MVPGELNSPVAIWNVGEKEKENKRDAGEMHFGAAGGLGKPRRPCGYGGGNLPVQGWNCVGAKADPRSASSAFRERRNFDPTKPL